MSLAWLTPPVQLHGSRMFMCDPLTTEECDWYKKRWHFWYEKRQPNHDVAVTNLGPRYIADYVFALPTVAFFMCTIGVFIISRVLLLVLGRRATRGPSIWRKLTAVARYLSYRGFYFKALRWNSAPVGVLLLGLIGTIFFFCEWRLNQLENILGADTIAGMTLAPGTFYWPDEMYGGSPALATRSGWMALACMPFVLYVDSAS